MERPASSMSMQSGRSRSYSIHSNGSRRTLADGTAAERPSTSSNDEMFLPTQLGPRPRSRKGGGGGSSAAGSRPGTASESVGSGSVTSGQQRRGSTSSVVLGPSSASNVQAKADSSGVKNEEVEDGSKTRSTLGGSENVARAPAPDSERESTALNGVQDDESHDKSEEETLADGKDELLKERIADEAQKPNVTAAAAAVLQKANGTEAESQSNDKEDEAVEAAETTFGPAETKSQDYQTEEGQAAEAKENEPTTLPKEAEEATALNAVSSVTNGGIISDAKQTEGEAQETQTEERDEINSSAPLSSRNVKDDEDDATEQGKKKEEGEVGPASLSSSKDQEAASSSQPIGSTAQADDAETDRAKSPSPPPVPPKSPRHQPQPHLRYSLPIGGPSRTSLPLNRSTSNFRPNAAIGSLKSSQSSSSVALHSYNAASPPASSRRAPMISSSSSTRPFKASSNSSLRRAPVASSSTVSLPATKAPRSSTIDPSSSSSSSSSRAPALVPALAPALALGLTTAQEENESEEETSKGNEPIARTASANSNRTARPSEANATAAEVGAHTRQVNGSREASQTALAVPSSSTDEATEDGQRPKMTRPKSTGNLEVDAEMASQRRPLVKTRPHAKSLLMVDGQMFLLDGEDGEGRGSNETNGELSRGEGIAAAAAAAAATAASSRVSSMEQKDETRPNGTVKGRPRGSTLDSSADSAVSAGFSDGKRGHSHISTNPSSLGSEALVMTSSSSLSKLAQGLSQPRAHAEQTQTQARAREEGDRDGEGTVDVADLKEEQAQLQHDEEDEEEDDDDDDDAPPGAYAIHPPSRARLAQAAKMPLYDADGRVCQFGDIFIKQRTLIVFLRHWFCPFCQMFSQSIQHVDPLPLQRANLDLVVVGQGHWHVTKSYMEVMNVPKWVKAYSDPSRNIYAALGMTLRTNDMGPASTRPDYQTKSILKASLSAMKKGVFDMPLRPPGDLKLLGGEFILGPGLQCSFTHRMVTTRGHLDLPRVLAQAGCDLSLKSAHAIGDEDDASSAAHAQSTRSADRVRARKLGGTLKFPVAGRKPVSHQTQSRNQPRPREARPSALLDSSRSMHDFDPYAGAGTDRHFSFSKAARTMPIKSVFRARPVTATSTSSSSTKRKSTAAGTGRARAKSLSSAAAVAAAARSRDGHAKSASTGVPKTAAESMTKTASPKTEIVEIRLPEDSRNTTERLTQKARLALPQSWSRGTVPRGLDVTLRSRRPASSDKAQSSEDTRKEKEARPTSSASTTAAREIVERPPLPTSSSSQAYLSAAARFHLSPERARRIRADMKPIANQTAPAEGLQQRLGGAQGLNDRSKSMANLSDLSNASVTRIDDETFSVSKTGGISSLYVLDNKASKSVSSLRDLSPLRPFHSPNSSVTRSKSQEKSPRLDGLRARDKLQVRPATTTAATTASNMTTKETASANKGLGIDEVNDSWSEKRPATSDGATEAHTVKSPSKDVMVTLPFRQHSQRRPMPASRGLDAADIPPPSSSSSSSPIVPSPSLHQQESASLAQPPPQVSTAMSAALLAAKKSSAMGGVPLSLFEKRILTSGHRFENTSPRTARDSSPRLSPATKSSPAVDVLPSSSSTANESAQTSSERPDARVPLAQQVKGARMFDDGEKVTEYKRMDRRQLEPVSPPRMTPSPQPIQPLRMVEPMPTTYQAWQQENPRVQTTDGPGPGGSTPTADVVMAGVADQEEEQHDEGHEKTHFVESEVQQLDFAKVPPQAQAPEVTVSQPREEVKEELNGEIEKQQPPQHRHLQPEVDDEGDESYSDEDSQQLARELQTAEVMERRIEPLSASSTSSRNAQMTRPDRSPTSSDDEMALPSMDFAGAFGSSGGAGGGGGSFLDDLEVIDGFQHRGRAEADTDESRSRGLDSMSPDSFPEYDEDEDDDDGLEGYRGDYAPIRASNSAPVLESSSEYRRRSAAANGHSAPMSIDEDDEESYSDDEELYRAKSRQGRQSGSSSRDYDSDDDEREASSRSTPRSTPSPSLTKRPATSPASSSGFSNKAAPSQRYNRTTKNRIAGTGNHHLYKPSSMTRITSSGSRPLSVFLEEEEEEANGIQSHREELGEEEEEEAVEQKTPKARSGAFM